jgi:subtilase family serine protease
MRIRSRPLSRWQRQRHRFKVVAAAAVAAALLGGCQAGSAIAGSATATTASGKAAADAGSGPAAGTDCLVTGAPVTCYTLRQFLVAYGIAPLLARGTDGRGQTVVLPEFAPVAAIAASDIQRDLAQFDRLSGLPAARLDVDTQLDPGASPDLAGKEEAGDAEMVHGIAPGAAIRVIMLPQFTGAAQATAAFAKALRLAPSLGQVVAVTFGLGESCYTPAEVTEWNAALQADRDQHVTVVASSGDNGAAVIPCNTTGASAPREGVNLPAASPLVLSVGGTSLQANRSTGVYRGETAWNTPPPPNVPIPAGLEPAEASNGGFSSLYPKPSYQDGVTGTGTRRGVPDVAADADPYTGTAGIQYVDGMQLIGPSSGTSAGAPFWAAIVALADQYAGHALGFINPAIYEIARGPRYHSAFHDITSGDNTVKYSGITVTGYRAAPGWDPVTGWGSPDAQVLVPLLAAGG